MKDESKSNRILCLYDELRAGKSINKAAWAKAHGVCERSVRRDLDTIQHYLCEKSRDDLGDMSLIRRQGKGKYGITNLDSRFLDEGEFLAVAQILAGSEAFSKEKLRTLLERLLLSAISEEGKEQLGSHVESLLENAPSHGEGIDTGTLWTAAKAVQTHHVLAFTYKTSGTEKEETLRVRPMQIGFEDGYFYLKGIKDSPEGEAAFLKDGPSTYLFSYIKGLKETKDTFTVPEMKPVSTKRSNK